MNIPVYTMNIFFFHGTYIEKLVVVKAMAPTPVLLPGKSHGWRSW